MVVVGLMKFYECQHVTCKGKRLWKRKQNACCLGYNSDIKIDGDGKMYDDSLSEWNNGCIGLIYVGIVMGWGLGFYVDGCLAWGVGSRASEAPNGA